MFGGHGGLANPAGGHSDAVVLARMLIGYDRYWPTVQDYENPFTPARLGTARGLEDSGDRVQQHQYRRAMAGAGRAIGGGDGQPRRERENARGMGSSGCDLRNPRGGGSLHADLGDSLRRTRRSFSALRASQSLGVARTTDSLGSIEVPL